MRKWALGLMVSWMAIGTATAQTVPMWEQARIREIFADPSDIVINLDAVGPCGSSLAHIRRSATNFQEMTALMFTAAAGGKTINIYINACEGDRNIISHGSAIFP